MPPAPSPMSSQPQSHFCFPGPTASFIPPESAPWSSHFNNHSYYNVPPSASCPSRPLKTLILIIFSQYKNNVKIHVASGKLRTHVSVKKEEKKTYLHPLHLETNTIYILKCFPTSLFVCISYYILYKYECFWQFSNECSTLKKSIIMAANI